MKKKSGLADSPFFAKNPVYEAPDTSVKVSAAKKMTLHPKISPLKLQTSRHPDIQTSRGTESETPRVPEKQTYRVPAFERYDVPGYRKMQRIEVRLTWEQNKYLDDLEALIGRDTPEGEKSDPAYRRITKNSILRVMVEILREMSLDIDASHFKSERDLLKALYQAVSMHFSKLKITRLPE